MKHCILAITLLIISMSAARAETTKALRQQIWATDVASKIRINWKSPIGTGNTSCKVKIQIAPNGEVISAAIVESCGADQALLQSIYKASPLPTPSNPDDFDPNLTLVFSTKDSPSNSPAMSVKDQADFFFSDKIADDFISRVLNYSSGCEEAGCINSDNVERWYKKSGYKCTYARARFSQYPDLLSFEKKQVSIDIKEKTIDLDSLDPRYIKIFTNGMGIIVSYEGKSLMSRTGDSADRVQNGWTLIYQKYCHGTKKDF